MELAVTCPLCGQLVRRSSLETHVRRELDYVPFACRLCPAAFPDAASATAHFGGPFAAHPGHALALAEFRDLGTEERLAEILSRAGQAPAQPHCQSCACGGPRREPAETAAPEPPRPLLQPPFKAPKASPAWMPAEQPQALPSGQPEPETPSSAWRPAEQASEAEAPPVKVQVKAELVEAKAEVLSDGKVACMLCGMRAVKRHFAQHVSDHHLSAARFHCGHCERQTKQKVHMHKHVTKAHGLAKDAEGAFTELDLRREVEASMEECFGSAKDVPAATKHCRSCKADVPATAVRTHIVAQHLRKPLHACLLCDFASAQMRPGEVARHLRKEHQRTLGPDTHRSDAEKYAPLVKKMTAQLFD